MPSWRPAIRRSADSMPTCAMPTIPLAGFLYGWVLLLVIQTGGMAAVTVTFARYFLELTQLARLRKICGRSDAGFADPDQLPRCEIRQPRAEWVNGAEDRRRSRSWWERARC